jgi:molybdenum cofactor cytidylyltransferase
MGRPKLLMPVLGQPLIWHTLTAWKQAGVSRIAVVARPDDVPLIELLSTEDVDVVVPSVAPAEMKASIAVGIEHIAAKYQPEDGDCWLVAPSDMPGLSPRIIGELLRVSIAEPGNVLIPTLAGKHGHPVLLPWALASQVTKLAANEGLNSLIDRNSPVLMACDSLVLGDEHAFADIDTPNDLVAFSKP